MILTIAILLLLLHTMFIRPIPGVLSCGLFGGSFNTKIDGKILWRIKSLGLFNQTRGSDSCGIWNGDKLIKGVGENKKFYDFVVNKGIPTGNGENNIFIGHTRQSTMGAHTEKNAHPFLIEDKMIFAHNGRVENYIDNGELKYLWAYCRENGINPTPIDVDSEGLGHLLLKNGVKILEKYKGYAALMFQYLDKPGTLCVYHGASKEFTSDDKPKEERPLFYMETPEGMYFSSMKEALLFIKEEGDKEPEILPHNVVFTVKDGKFINKTEEIKREGNNCFFPSYRPQTTTTYPITRDSGNNSSSSGPRTAAQTSRGLDTPKNGWDIETESQPAFKQWSLYFHKNRYYYHKRDGSFVLADGALKIECKTAEVLANGVEPKDDIKTTTFYFFKGILLRDQKTFNTVEKQLKQVGSDLFKHMNQDNLNFAKFFSKYSKYPITNVGSEAKNVEEEFRKMFYVKGKPATESITPLWSERRYTYKEGRLKSLTASGGESTDTFFRKASSGNAGTGSYPNDTYAEAFNKAKDAQGLHSFRDFCRSQCSGSAETDIEKLKSIFYKVYDNMEKLETDLSGYGMVALKLYLYELMDKVFDGANPSAETYEKLCFDLVYEAVAMKVSISDLMERNCESIEYYLGQALLDTDKDDEDKDDKEEVVGKKKVESTVYKQLPLIPSKIVPLYSDEGFHKLNDKNLRDMEIAKQNVDASNIIRKVLTELDDARDVSSNLGKLELSHFAEKAEEVIKDGIAAIKDKLIDILDKNKRDGLVKDIKSSMVGS